MSTFINPEPEPVSPTPTQPASQDPAVAGEAVRANATLKDFTMSTTLGSLGELRSKAPVVYDKMMMGIAQNIVHEMREHAERLKKMMRESREH